MKINKTSNILALGFLALSFFIFNSCKTDKKPEVIVENHSENKVENFNCEKHLSKNKENNLNISFLLDLSDRISPKKYPNPSMEYKDRDLGYIESVANVFSNHLLNKRSILIHDKMQFFLEPAPANADINEKIKTLNLRFNRENATKEAINNIKPTYKTSAKEMYDLAIKDNKYIGSDIWRFFKNKAKKYCVEDCYRNILVILTDGYIYHKNTKLNEGTKSSYITPQTLRNKGLNKSNYKEIIEQKKLGFINVNQDLNNLEVLVLGIENHDKKNMYGKDVIKEYWSEWLKEMKVKRFEIHNTDLPVNVDKIINKFINK